VAGLRLIAVSLDGSSERFVPAQRQRRPAGGAGRDLGSERFVPAVAGLRLIAVSLGGSSERFVPALR
jgi:hypothetical protein